MNVKILCLQIAAVMVSCMLLNLSIVSATTFRVIYNDEIQASIEYSFKDLINTGVVIVRDPSDISWSKIKIRVTINSASLSHTIKKIYIYKCKVLDPVTCSQLEPEEYDTFADVEYSWEDISQREGAERYPEVANLMILVKLEGPYETSSWTGILERIERRDYNIFVTSEDEIDSVNLYSKAQEYIQPIIMYIENFGMIPFNWLEKVVLSNTDKIYALGGSQSELESSPPQLTSAITESDTVDTINKDYYFLFPESSGRIISPVVLNLNPFYTCGNGECELSKGETSANCCYDCGCGEGLYCDASPDAPSTGTCRALADMNLEVPPVTVQIDNCLSQTEIVIPMRINNAPTTLSDTAEATFSIDDTQYLSTCSKSSPSTYECPVMLSPPVSCGQGSETSEIKDITLTITYFNGPNQETRELSQSSSSILWNYDCACGEGLYCDIGTHECESEDAISLGIIYLTSYLKDYQPGDTINVTAKIFNPPTDTVLISASAQLNLTNGEVSPGTPVCSEPTEDFEYNCSIPFSITNYNPELNYKFQPNTLIFQITYSDGAVKKTKTLSVSEGFYPITIPSKRCGDGKIDPGETPETCCQDAGCYSDDEYCDSIGECRPIDGIRLSIESVNPLELEDCLKEHEISILAKIQNPPTGLHLDFYSYQLGGETGTAITCREEYSGSGLFNCTILVPEQPDCGSSGIIFDDNYLNFTISFPDGSRTRTMELSAELPAITLTPIFHCGEYGCETEFGENSENCCIDCGCPSGEFCNYDPTLDPHGTCIKESDIRLVIDSPASPVTFKTCEIRNRLNVKAHIENAPYNFRVEEVYGKIGNNLADIFCEKKGDENIGITFNCTMFVPKESKCSVHPPNNRFVYVNNSVSFFISYRDGKTGKTLTRELTAQLPPITTTQEYESMYDIVTASVKEIRKTLYETLDIANSLMNWYERCIDLVKKFVWLSMIATITSVFIGVWGMLGFPKIEVITKEPYKGVPWTGRDVGQFVTGVSRAFGSIVDVIMKYCELASKMYELNLKVQRIKMEQEKMNLCIKMWQHTLDTGGCTNREESCFASMANCVDFTNVETWSNELSRTLRQSSSIASDIADSLGEAGKGFATAIHTWEEASLGRYAQIKVKCGKYDMQPGLEDQVCCDYDIQEGTSIGCNEPITVFDKNYIKFSSYSPRNYCNIPAYVKCTKKSENENFVCEYSNLIPLSTARNIAWESVFQYDSKYYYQVCFKFYCFKDDIEFRNIREKLSQSHEDTEKENILSKYYIEGEDICIKPQIHYCDKQENKWMCVPVEDYLRWTKQK